MKKSGFSLGEFILGVLFIIAALFAFREPLGSVLGLMVFFAIAAILRGVHSIYSWWQIKKEKDKNMVFLLLVGILNIIVAILLLRSPGAGMVAMTALFAFWFIFDSVGRIITSIQMKDDLVRPFWFNILMGVLGLILGVILLMNPLTAMLTVAFIVGINFMLVGILYIVSAFK